ncbi:hypothetical protein [Alicyclobacillus dauci]|uniref:Uncharacterized protein n=1 Tax=Alicyclobacillus dauci TaxID=1475485 RepID=A0ABY6Z2A9_9BACL|nr:hypothetical protein [Alicyclobacillus dauci]WAH36419.1 hypothetical protein NZD86_19705 [Alicyclobacillus dauci]
MDEATISWLMNLENETIMWMIISVIMLGGTGFGLLFWDRFLYRQDEQTNQERR